MKVLQLKELCQQRGMPISPIKGCKKAELVGSLLSLHTRVEHIWLSREGRGGGSLYAWTVVFLKV